MKPAFDESLPDLNLPWPINLAGVTLLAHSELLRLVAYRDITGKPTIGWGQTDHVKMGMVWAREYADRDLLHGLIEYTDAVKAMCKVPTGSNQLAALVVCAWNIGIAGMSGSSMMRKHNLGDFVGASAAFALWNKAHVRGQLVVSAELVGRRAEEAALYSRIDDATQREPVPQTVITPEP